ncbi:MAG: hypothetical protein KHY89_02295 [Butyricicoccus pullicaecorum]|nr:hypothetical protein [Butyricicoccus pullicaecorum]
MKFDRYMHESMQEMTQDISPDPMLRARVMNAVQTDRTKTRPRRMRFVLAAAAMVCVLVTGAFAAGPIVGLYSSSWADGNTQSLSDEAKLEKQAGFSIRLPETLGSAAFQNMEVVPVNAVDADGNIAYSYNEFYASYQDGTTHPFLSVYESKNISSDAPLSDKTLVDTREIDGISVTYRQIPTIFLPPDGSIKPTDAEVLAEKNGECFISYGTETRVDGLYHTISWEQDGLYYTVGSSDGDWDTEEFFAAAQSVIRTKS